MTSRYTKVARITAQVEETLRRVDQVLSVGFGWGDLKWKCRELWVTNIEDHDSTSSSRGSYVGHTKLVQLVGITTNSRKVTAIAKFEGCTHLLESAFDEKETVDHSEPLTLEEIELEIITENGTKVKKTCFIEIAGSTFLLKQPAGG